MEIVAAMSLGGFIFLGAIIISNSISSLDDTLREVIEKLQKEESETD